MSSKIIVITVVVLIIASFSMLFFVEAKNHNYDYNKSWNVVYFDNPRDESLDFAIENHQGLDAEYAYKIFINDNKVIDSSVEISAGMKQQISPVLDSGKIKGGRVMIDVNYKDTDYKIYKDLGN